MGKNKHTVLVIEDNELNREILCEILEDNYEVYSAENGALGMDLLHELKLNVDIILLDIQMPVMNGYEVMEAVAADNILRDIPIVVMTSAEAPEEELKCLNLGASDFLRKPYNPMLINLRLSNIIRLRESLMAGRQQKLFIDNITHEIRTPLNAIMGFSQLLAMPGDALDDEDREQYCGMIVSNTKRLLWMIEDALILADMENGQFQINKYPTFINSICRELVDSTKEMCPEGVKSYFVSDFDDDYTINTDGDNVQHLLVNLVSNAYKWTHEGEIRVHSTDKKTPGYLTISVADTGPGVPEDKAEYIFERFAKLDAFVPGNGLGLSIARMIANRLGAKVYLDTEYKQGAKFVLQIPLDKQED